MKERELWEVQEVVAQLCCPVHCPDAVIVAELPTILHHTHTQTLATLISACKCVACVCALGRVMQLTAHVAVAVASSSPLSPCDNAIML